MKKNKNVKNLFTYSPIHLFTPKKKAAFTLAEVLITLGIIGVVAAMTIPNLIAEQQKRTTVTKLQRAMSVLNQAYRRAYDDVGEATVEEANAMDTDVYFNKYWAPYLKTIEICETHKDCGYKDSNVRSISGGLDITLGSINGSRILIRTLDGFTYFFVNNFLGKNGVSKSGRIYVDINGEAQPNTLGKDWFVFDRVIDGEKGGVVLPYGQDKTDSEIKKDCKKKSYGLYCAEIIRRAGWKIEKDYPW